MDRTGFTGVPSPLAMEYVPDVVTHAGSHAPDWGKAQVITGPDATHNGALVLTYCTCGDPNCGWSGRVSPRDMCVCLAPTAEG